MNGNLLGKIEACFYKILILGRFAHRGWARRSLAFQAWEAAVRFFNTGRGVCGRLPPPAWSPAQTELCEGVGEPTEPPLADQLADIVFPGPPGQYFSDCVSKT